MNYVFAFADQGKAFVDGLIPSLVCIIVVFAVLALIMGILYILNAVKPKIKEEKESVPTTPSPLENSKTTTKMEDIKDEDMMVAVLIATIDYRNEIKQDVHLVNVKQIG